MLTVRVFPCLLVSMCVLASSACDLFQKDSPTSPSPGGGSSLVGMWIGSTGVAAPAGACTGFQWRITNVTGSSVTGDFIATCAGNVPVTGTASGTMTGNTIAWNASGAAIAAGIVDCRFLLSGTAVVEGDTIRVPYSGSTCLGPVSGTEMLRKR